MYIVQNAVRNLYRYRRRYLIVSAALIGMLALYFYGMVYRPQIRDYNDVCREKMLSRVELRFRDDLQYLGSRGKDDTSVNYADERQNFNADGSMDAYDYDLLADREFFEQFAVNPYIAEMELGYGCRVYRDMAGMTGAKASKKGLILYGGSLTALNCYLNEMTDRDFPREIHVVEGREANPGQAECMLYRDMAAYNGLKIGDTIELYDEHGGELIRLKIVGLAVCYINYGDRMEEEDPVMLGYRIGSMPYRRLKTTLLYHVFTDFDTAHGVYGTPDDPCFEMHHTFNHYIPIYKLQSQEVYDEFIQSLEELTYDRNLHFYQLNSACEPYLREYDERAADLTAVTAGCFCIITALSMLGFLLWERRRETGIARSVGAEKRQILIGWMVENAVFLVPVSAAAFFLASCTDGILRFFGTSYFVRQFAFVPSAESVTWAVLSVLILFCLTALESCMILNRGTPLKKLTGK